jgi:hypothetical protein
MRWELISAAAIIRASHLHPASAALRIHSPCCDSLLGHACFQEREAALLQFGPPPTAAALSAAAQAATVAALSAGAAAEKPAPGQAVPTGQAVSLSTAYSQPSSFVAAPKLSPEALAAEKKRLVGLIAAASNLEEINDLQKQLETLIANNA